jgi:outer membrane immunogenic protein
MTFKHFAPIGATLALALATPAMAQQDSGKVDWTGPYVGGSFGYNWSKGDGGEHLRFDTDGDGNYDNVVTTAAGHLRRFGTRCDAGQRLQWRQGCDRLDGPCRL